MDKKLIIFRQETVAHITAKAGKTRIYHAITFKLVCVQESCLATNHNSCYHNDQWCEIETAYNIQAGSTLEMYVPSAHITHYAIAAVNSDYTPRP